MRFRKADLGAAVKYDVALECTETCPTSYAGPELLGRYLRARQLNRVIGNHLDPSLSGDFGRSGFVRLILAVLLFGCQRLRYIGSFGAIQ